VRPESWGRLVLDELLLKANPADIVALARDPSRWRLTP
jgi:hypothetical protein